MNKSKRQWKVGTNRNPQKNYRNKGQKMSWEEKKQRSQSMKILRDDLKVLK